TIAARPVIAQEAVARTVATATATIARIDARERFLLLRDDDGSEVGLFVPADFSRMNELRIGDAVIVTVDESVAYRRSRSGVFAAGTSESVDATESATELPGVTVSHRLTETVTVEAVDRDEASITVTGLGGRRVAHPVDLASDLDGVGPGDRLDITYTETLLAT